MSQYPSSFDQPPRPVSSGMAIAALVCALLGLCIPGAGLVGLVLGIVAMSKASSSPQTHGGKGMALAGIIVGSLSLVWMLIAILNLGILLPALGKARESARQLKSSVQLRQIDMALLMYADDNKGWLPEAGADWQSRLNIPDAAMFVSPRAENAGATDSYIYIPGYNMGQVKSPTVTVIAYENPKYVQRGLVSVAYADGHVDAVRVEDLQRTLANSPKPSAPSGRP